MKNNESEVKNEVKMEESEVKRNDVMALKVAPKMALKVAPKMALKVAPKIPNWLARFSTV